MKPSWQHRPRSFEDERAYQSWDRKWEWVGNWLNVGIYVSFGFAFLSLHEDARGWFFWFMGLAILGITAAILGFGYRMRGLRSYLAQLARERAIDPHRGPRQG